MLIGILGLQGACAPHEGRFAALGASTRRVVNPEDLHALDGLLIPGGESTTMLKTATPELWSGVSELASRRPVWGVCAGCILMAQRVSHPAQPSLGIVDIDVMRNFYGAQNESFVAPLSLQLEPPASLRGVFIRAPRITRVGEGLRVIATHEEAPVMVLGRRHLVTTFHPELTDSAAVHELFLSRCAE